MTPAPTLVGMRLAFATAVAKRGGSALLIDSDNGSEGWVPIREAVISGRAFAVDVRPEMLAIDADSRAIGARAELLATDLVGEGLRPVVIASGRVGHRHVFALTPDRNELRRLEQAIKADDANHFDIRRTIRPPLAPHRLGLPVSLVYPDTYEAALRALAPPVNPPLPSLTPRIQRLLRYGDEEHRYQRLDGLRDEVTDRSRMMQAIVTGMVNAKWQPDAMYAALSLPANVGGERLQDVAVRRGQADARIELARSIAKAKLLPPPSWNRAGALATIDLIEATATASQFRGRTGATDLAVLSAHILIARRIGSLIHAGSVREIAEVAGIDKSTASASHHRLVSGGWLIRLRRTTHAEVAHWQLCQPPHVSAIRTVETSRGGCEPNCPDNAAHVAAPIWRRNALGKPAFKVWCTLSPTPAAIPELSERLKLGARALLRHLVALEKLDLADRQESGWTRGKVDPAAVMAVDRRTREPVTQQAARQRERHRRDRERYAPRREALNPSHHEPESLAGPPSHDPASAETHE